MATGQPRNSTILRGGTESVLASPWILSALLPTVALQLCAWVHRLAAVCCAVERRQVADVLVRTQGNGVYVAPLGPQARLAVSGADAADEDMVVSLTLSTGKPHWSVMVIDVQEGSLLGWSFAESLLPVDPNEPNRFVVR